MSSNVRRRNRKLAAKLARGLVECFDGYPNIQRVLVRKITEGHAPVAAKLDAFDTEDGPFLIRTHANEPPKVGRDFLKMLARVRNRPSRGHDPL